VFYAADGKVVLSSGKHFTCETPLLRQVYDALDVAGKAGLTISELMKQFGLNYCDCRNLLKNVCRKGLAVFTMHDQGKNEVRRFVFYALCLCAAYFKNQMSRLHKILCACCTSTWLCRLVTVQLVMCFQFCECCHAFK